MKASRLWKSVFLTAGILWAGVCQAANWGGTYRDSGNGFTVKIVETGLKSGTYTTSDGDWGQWYEDPSHSGEIVFLSATPPFDNGRARITEQSIERTVIEFEWKDDPKKPGDTPGCGTARRIR